MSMEYKTRRTGSTYATFAFGSVVLTAFASFFANQRYFTPASCVPVVFACGAVYVSLGILSGSYGVCRTKHALGYYVSQCLLLTAIVFLSPSRGYMAIVVLPLLSQSIFDLHPRWATAVGLYLFGISIGVWAVPFGWSGLGLAVMNYCAAFIFTVAFTLITKQAIVAREREAALREAVEAANRQLREHAAQAEELATTRERNRLAREIHDGVGHYLTVIKTQLDAAAALMATQPDKAHETVVKAARLSSDALDDVRRSVGALRTDAARPALVDALRALTLEAGMPVSVRIEGFARSLPPGVEHALFRSAQEGLTNVRKHAGATAIELALDFRSDGRVALAVIDNGRGGTGSNGQGFGLRGIRERIELLGGRVESGPRHEGGFALSVEVPA